MQGRDIYLPSIDEESEPERERRVKGILLNSPLI